MKKLRFSLLMSVMAALALFLSAKPILAADVLITTDQLKQKIDAKEPLVLIDALSAIEHDEMYIAGSINIPSSKVTADNPLLPADKNALLIFYCKGPKCSKSKVAANAATALGYTNVMIYNEGLPAWAGKGYPVEKKVDYPKVDLPRLSPVDVQAMADSAVLLDIRGEEVKDVGRIKNAVAIPLDDLSEQFTSLPKDKKIVIMDHAGKQVGITGKFLHMKGYTDLAILDGGMLAWKRAGLPTE
ncbi:MAG: rhodanese-like domain-containing protein [Thermodesulfobacteriota bacterium]